MQRFELPGVVAAAFSPNATFLQTFQQPTKDAGNSAKNLKVSHFHREMVQAFVLACLSSVDEKRVQ